MNMGDKRLMIRVRGHTGSSSRNVTSRVGVTNDLATAVHNAQRGLPPELKATMDLERPPGREDEKAGADLFHSILVGLLVTSYAARPVLRFIADLSRERRRKIIVKYRGIEVEYEGPGQDGDLEAAIKNVVEARLAAAQECRGEALHEPDLELLIELEDPARDSR